MRQASTVRLSIHLPLLRSLSTCQLGRAEGVLASVAALTSLRKIGLSELTELNALMGVGGGLHQPEPCRKKGKLRGVLWKTVSVSGCLLFIYLLTF